MSIKGVSGVVSIFSAVATIHPFSASVMNHLLHTKPSVYIYCLYFCFGQRFQNYLIILLSLSLAVTFGCHFLLRSNCHPCQNKPPVCLPNYVKQTKDTNPVIIEAFGLNHVETKLWYLLYSRLILLNFRLLALRPEYSGGLGQYRVIWCLDYVRYIGPCLP